MRQLLKYLMVAALMLPSLTWSLGLDDIVRQAKENEAKRAAEQVKPKAPEESKAYTPQEAIRYLHILWFNDFQGYTLRESYRAPRYEAVMKQFGFIEFDKARMAQFELDYFGGQNYCGGWYAPLPNYGETTGAMAVLEGTLIYLEGNVDQNPGRQRAGEYRVKEWMSKLEQNSEQHCPANERNALLKRLRDYLNLVIAEGPAIVARKKQLVQALDDIEKGVDKANREYTHRTLERAFNNAEKLDACARSKPYQVFSAAVNIRDTRQALADTQRVIDREKEGAKISGYVNKERMYAAGNQIAQYNRALQQQFEAYKKAGGSARSIEAVTVSGPNPCAKEAEEYAKPSPRR